MVEMAKTVFKQSAGFALTFLLIAFCVRLFIGMVLYPIGGGEFHAIFAGLNGGNYDVAWNVYVTYIMVTLAFCGLLILCRYPMHWLLISLAGCTVCGWFWWLVYSFGHQSTSFHAAARAGFPPIPFFIHYGCLWAKRTQPFLKIIASRWAEISCLTTGRHV